MELSLSPEIERKIRYKVASGLYLSPDDVIREALQLLDDRDLVRAKRLEELRAMVAVGIEQADRGEVAPLDMEDIRAEVRRRLTDESR